MCVCVGIFFSCLVTAADASRSFIYRAASSRPPRLCVIPSGAVGTLLHIVITKFHVTLIIQPDADAAAAVRVIIVIIEREQQVPYKG